MNILVADDDELMLKTLEYRLKRDGHHVYLSKNGKEALQTFEALSPDLVLTDITMPHSSGLQITESIRMKSKVPIIIMSALGQEKVVIEAFNLGADDFLNKPFGPNELLARIRRFNLKPR